MLHLFESLETRALLSASAPFVPGGFDNVKADFRTLRADVRADIHHLRKDVHRFKHVLSRLGETSQPSVAAEVTADLNELSLAKRTAIGELKSVRRAFRGVRSDLKSLNALGLESDPGFEYGKPARITAAQAKLDAGQSALAQTAADTANALVTTFTGDIATIASQFSGSSRIQSIAERTASNVSAASEKLNATVPTLNQDIQGLNYDPLSPEIAR